VEDNLPRPCLDEFSTENMAEMKSISRKPKHSKRKAKGQLFWRLSSRVRPQFLTAGLIMSSLARMRFGHLKRIPQPQHRARDFGFPARSIGPA